MARSNQLKQDPVVAARAIAQAEVARHWPELADVEPTVAPRQCYTPDTAELSRLGATGRAPARARPWTPPPATSGSAASSGSHDGCRDR